MSKHYCFEGICHEAVCCCNCPSCREHRRQTKFKEFNEQFFESIKKSRESLFMLIMHDDDMRNKYIENLKNKVEEPVYEKPVYKESLMKRVVSFFKSIGR